MECYSKLNFTQNAMSLKMECHLNWNVTQIWNVAKNLMSFKIECHLKRNFTQNGVLLKMECHSK